MGRPPYFPKTENRKAGLRLRFLAFRFPDFPSYLCRMNEKSGCRTVCSRLGGLRDGWSRPPTGGGAPFANGCIQRTSCGVDGNRIYKLSNTRKRMKKVLILSSSPRRGGNSDRLCDEFLRGAQEAGHSAGKIFLRDMRIGYCTGCGVCESGKPCPQRDDAAGIVERMIASDVIVMATPVYFYTMSAQMKTLIDRCCARYRELADKEFYFLLTAADEDVAAMQRTVEGFRGFLDCLENPVERGVIYGVGAWKMHEIDGTPALGEAYEAGRNI